MPTPQTRSFKLVAGFILATAAITAAQAQVAPAPAPAAPEPAATFKAGWVAQVVSYKNEVMGEVPLTTFILGIGQDDVFVHIDKQYTAANGAGLILRGLINAPEPGRYGFLYELKSIQQPGGCNFVLTVDGTKVMSARGPYQRSLTADKALDLAAGRHPVELRIGCASVALPKVTSTLRVKMPSSDELTDLGSEFILHQTRASGD